MIMIMAGEGAVIAATVVAAAAATVVAVVVVEGAGKHLVLYLLLLTDTPSTIETAIAWTFNGAQQSTTLTMTIITSTMMMTWMMIGFQPPWEVSPYTNN